MIQQGQGSEFSLKAADHLVVVHASLYDFEGNLALKGLLLFSEKDNPGAAFPDLLTQIVSANSVAWLVISSKVRLPCVSNALKVRSL
jgi:hypothetical protein